MRVFVDTAYFIARLKTRDQWHERAVEAAKGTHEFVTSSLVINETISLVQCRGATSAALQFLTHTRANPALQIIYPEPAIQSLAWDLFHRWAGIGANGVDCVSFAIMQRFSIRKAFTFDAHFRVAGFDTLL